MNLIRRHPYLTLMGCFGLLALFLGFELLSTLEDVKAYGKIMNGDVSLPPLPGARAKAKLPKYSLALLKGFTVPADLEIEVNQQVGSAWTEGKRLFPDASEATELYEKIASQTPLAMRFADHLASHMDSLPTCASLPEMVDYGASTANYREIRTTARFSAFLAQYLAQRGKPDQAWVLACGPLLLGYHLEAEESTCAGLPLITRMISIVVRKIGTQALFELAPLLEVNRQRALATIALLQRIEAGMYSIITSLDQESKMLPSMAIMLQHAYVHGAAKKMFSSGPSMLTLTLSDPERVKRHLDPYYDPFRKVDGRPWKDVQPAAASVTKLLEAVMLKTSNPSTEWVLYAFQPSHLILDFLVGLSTPNMKKAIEQDYTCRQSMRGIGIAYGVAAFHREQGRWPATLSEAQQWLQVPFPEDLFTGDPLKYELKATDSVDLRSPGPDLLFGTSDDMVFLPFPPAQKTPLPPGLAENHHLPGFPRTGRHD